MRKLRMPAVIALSAGLASLPAIADEQMAAPANAGFAQGLVDENGIIALPENVQEEWAHLGSWAIVNGAEDGAGDGMHHVYTTPDVIAHYQETGEFKDGAVIAKQVTGLSHAALATGEAHWTTDTAVWFIMVKDRQGRFQDSGLWGNGWGWALYNGDDLTKQVATDYETDCLGCHVPVQEHDYIYVYGYPALNRADAAPAR